LSQPREAAHSSAPGGLEAAPGHAPRPFGIIFCEDTFAKTVWDAAGDDSPETAAAASLLSTVIAEQYFEQLTRWLEASPGEPAEWQQAAMLGDRILYVTPAELEELGGRVREVVDEYFERQVRPELRPEGARLVTWLNIAFPNDFRKR
jgi:hypothetical protein